MRAWGCLGLLAYLYQPPLQHRVLLWVTLKRTNCQKVPDPTASKNNSQLYSVTIKVFNWGASVAKYFVRPSVRDEQCYLALCVSPGQWLIVLGEGGKVGFWGSEKRESGYYSLNFSSLGLWPGPVHCEQAWIILHLVTRTRPSTRSWQATSSPNLDLAAERHLH